MVVDLQNVEYFKHNPDVYPHSTKIHLYKITFEKLCLDSRLLVRLFLFKFVNFFSLCFCLARNSDRIWCSFLVLFQTYNKISSSSIARLGDIAIFVATS